MSLLTLKNLQQITFSDINRICKIQLVISVTQYIIELVGQIARVCSQAKKMPLGCGGGETLRRLVWTERTKMFARGRVQFSGDRSTSIDCRRHPRVCVFMSQHSGSPEGNTTRWPERAGQLWRQCEFLDLFLFLLSSLHHY